MVLSESSDDVMFLILSKLCLAEKYQLRALNSQWLRVVDKLLLSQKSLVISAWKKPHVNDKLVFSSMDSSRAATALRRALTKSPNLSSFTVDNVSFPGLAGIVVQTCPDLRQLSIWSHEVNMSTIAHLVNGLHLIERFAMASIFTVTDSVIELMSIKWKHLKALEIQVSAKEFHGTAFSRFPLLESLNIMDSAFMEQLSDLIVGNIVTGLSKSLTMLAIRKCSKAGLFLICAKLVRLTNLAIYVGWREFYPDDIEISNYPANNMHALRSLDIRHCEVPVAGLLWFLQACPELKQLTLATIDYAVISQLPVLCPLIEILTLEAVYPISNQTLRLLASLKSLKTMHYEETYYDYNDDDGFECAEEDTFILWMQSIDSLVHLKICPRHRFYFSLAFVEACIAKAKKKTPKTFVVVVDHAFFALENGFPEFPANLHLELTSCEIVKQYPITAI